MKVTGVIATIALLAFLSAPTHAPAQEMTLEGCKSLQSRIEEYDRLRRRGGSAQQMEAWRKERDEVKRRFKDNDCKKWGRGLK